MADDEEVVEEEAEAVTGGESETGISPVEAEKPLAPPKYEVRPGLGEKFQAQNVRDIIITSMQEQLMGRQYRSDLAPRWAKVIANGVRQRVQELDMKRYKILVQCMILEMKGAGIKCGQRCIWDPETDDYVEVYRYLRDVCVVTEAHDRTMIGGANACSIVEVEETDPEGLATQRARRDDDSALPPRWQL